MGRRGGNNNGQPLPLEDLNAAGLRYTTDVQPGIRRRRQGRGFAYAGPDGAPVRDEKVLRRIRSLVIPPAWTDVWISPIENGHIQAVGRDSKGRRQYRYHPRWREVRDENKFDRALAFAEALPGIREAVDRDMSLPGLPRRKVLATVVRLLDTTLARVGNAEYARQNGSFGLTTLRTRHVEVNGSSARFSFKGKNGKECDLKVSDARVAGVLRCCLDLPGYELFQYIDEDGRRQSIDSADVNDYLGEVSGAEFTAKDFRTWAGTVLTAGCLLAVGPPATVGDGKATVVEAIKEVSSKLGNTPAVSRNCYIHPLVLEAYESGALFDAEAGRTGDGGEGPDESLVLSLLRRAASVNEAA